MSDDQAEQPGKSKPRSAVDVDNRTREVAELLDAFAGDSSDSESSSKLVALIYTDLRKLARQNLRQHNRSGTLNTTALVHESYLRLARSGSRAVENRKHFYNLASLAMRQVICDHARRRLRERERFDRNASSEEALALLDNKVAQANQILAIDDALADLAKLEPRQARIVECKYFSGLSDIETAEALSISERTVYREWARAKQWLETYLTESK